jgi:surface antigen
MKPLAIGLSAFVLSACNVSTTSTTSGDPGPKEQIGAISGMIVGGAIANDIAEGSKNEGLATVLGAFIGGVMGQSIGSQLDELDRQMAQSAYNEALEYNRSDVSTDWVNPDSGNSGSFTQSVLTPCVADTAVSILKRLLLGVRSKRAMGPLADNQMEVGKS